MFVESAATGVKNEKAGCLVNHLVGTRKPPRVSGQETWLILIIVLSPNVIEDDEYCHSPLEKQSLVCDAAVFISNPPLAVWSQENSHSKSAS